jgi:hypothetical protein
MAATGNSCFCLGDFFKSFPKPLGQMNRNLVGSIYGRSSIKIAHFIPIRWPSGFGNDLKKSPKQKQELPVAAMFANRSA